MKFLVDFIKGIFVGVANVIPGVSGGTMAVSFGIYDKMLSCIANLFKDFKNCVKTLFPIVVGMVFGVIGFTFIIPWLLKHAPFVTSMAFTGLIIGGMPMLSKSLKNAWADDKHKSKAVCVIMFLALAVLAVAMLFMNGDKESGVLIEANPANMIIVFFMGVIASATMIIPGVSGSLVLMILGYYFGIISAVKDFISALKDMDINEMVNQGLILAPFGIGCILGIFFISKLIKWLFSHFPSATFSAILGLVVVSPFSIFFKVNEEYGLSDTKLSDILLGGAIFIACTYVTIFMGKLESDE